MKKFLAIMVASIMALSISACGNNSEPKPNDSENKETVETNKEDGVEVTLPSFFFEGIKDEDIKSDAKAMGIEDCTINSDRSVTYKMTDEVRTTILDEFKGKTEQIIDEYVKGDNAIKSFVKIDVNDDMSEFNVYVHKNLFSEGDTFCKDTFFMNGVYYQLYNGVAEKDADVVVNFIDDATKENISTETYSEWLAGMQNN